MKVTAKNEDPASCSHQPPGLGTLKYAATTVGRMEKGECNIDQGPHWAQFCLRTMGNRNCFWEPGTQEPPRAILPPIQHTLSQNDGFLLVGQVCGSENIKPLLGFQHLIATFIPSFTLWAQKWVLGGLQDVLSYSCPHSTQKVEWTWQGRLLKQYNSCLQGCSADSIDLRDLISRLQHWCGTWAFNSGR